MIVQNTLERGIFRLYFKAKIHQIAIINFFKKKNHSPKLSEVRESL
jgi:hypothetical protein